MRSSPESPILNDQDAKRYPQRSIYTPLNARRQPLYYSIPKVDWVLTTVNDRSDQMTVTTSVGLASKFEGERRPKSGRQKAARSHPPARGRRLIEPHCRRRHQRGGNFSLGIARIISNLYGSHNVKNWVSIVRFCEIARIGSSHLRSASRAVADKCA
jgi:hypothetical protein